MFDLLNPFHDLMAIYVLVWLVAGHIDVFTPVKGRIGVYVSSLIPWNK